MNIECHAYNKDSVSAEEKSEFLLSRQPPSVKSCRKPNFDNSLKYADGSDFLIYIGHVDEDEQKGGQDELSRVEAELSNLSGEKTTAVFIRCSSVGRRGQPHRVLGQLTVLELQPPFTEMHRADWQHILKKMAPANCRAVADGNVPNCLHKYFALKRPTSLLSALAILCQGYLAAKAEPDGEGGNEHLPVLVKEALDKMGWYEIADSPLLKPALRGKDEVGLKTIRVDVVSEDYWAALGVTAELADKCAREWIPGGSAKDLEDLKRSEKFKLIRALDSGVFPIKDDEIVAKTYLALHERLEPRSE